MSSNLSADTEAGTAIPDPVTDEDAGDVLDPREAADLALDLVDLTGSLFALVLPPHDLDLVDDPRPPSTLASPPASVPMPASVPLPRVPPDSLPPEQPPAATPRAPEPIPLPVDPPQHDRPGSARTMSMLDEISFLDD